MVPATKGTASGGITSYMKHQCAVNNRSTVHLMTVLADTEGEARCASVRAFIDTGAQISLISTALVKAIKPWNVGVERLRICTIGWCTEEGVLNLYKLTVIGKVGRYVVVHGKQIPRKPATHIPTSSILTSTLRCWC